MQESPFTITVSDNAEVYGVLHPCPQPALPLVVLVHGLTGHMDEYIHLCLARRLHAAGYPVIRFNQYGDEERARRFHTTTIREHVADTEAVVRYAHRQGFSRVVLAGHSLGAPVAIAAAGASIQGVILIDPTGRPTDRIKEWEARDSECGVAFLDWSRRIILGERWIADAKSFPDSYKQFAHLACPVQIIAAEKGQKISFCVRYHEAHPEHPEIQVVPNATHCFPELGSVEALAVLISDWLARNVG